MTLLHHTFRQAHEDTTVPFDTLRYDRSCCSELPAVSAAEVGAARIGGIGLASLSLTPDGRLLAVATADGAVALHSVRALSEFMQNAVAALADSATPPAPYASWELLDGDSAVQVPSIKLIICCSTANMP